MLGLGPVSEGSTQRKTAAPKDGGFQFNVR
jgi:hypothetical protein